MKNWYLVFLLICGFLSTLFAQEKQLALKEETDRSVRLTLLERQNIDQKIAEVIKLQDTLPREAERIIVVVLAMSEKGNYNLGKLQANALLFGFKLKNGAYDEAFYYARNQMKVAKQLQDSLSIAESLISQGRVYSALGNVSNSLKFYLDARDFTDKLSDKKLQHQVYSQIARLYYLQANYEKAKAAVDKAIAIGNTGSREDEVDNLTLLSQISTLNESFDNAIGYSQKAITVAQVIDYEIGEAQGYADLAEGYIAKNQLDSAIIALEKGLNIRKKIQDDRKLFNIYDRLGDVYFYQKKYQKSLAFTTLSLEIADRTNTLPFKAIAYQNYALTYRAMKDYEKAFNYQSDYSEIQDSLFLKQQTTSLKNLEITRAIENKQAIEEVRLEEKLKTAQIDRKYDLLKIIGISFLLIALLTFYFVRNRFRNQLNVRDKQAAYLEKVDAMKDDFLANTSHELRTPLNGIIGIAASMQDTIGKDSEEKTQNNLALIVNSGKRLAKLINSILDFSKLKSHDLVLNKKPVDLHSNLKIILQISQHSAKEKGIKLINKIPKIFPAVAADEDRLQQILHNLIGNAIKFTEKGSVAVGATEQEEMVEIYVQDTGIGIPSDKLKLIFEAFEQVDSSIERQFGGTGLGLSITKSLVKLHGGKIRVESELGQGTTLFFTIPKSLEKAADAAAEHVNILMETAETKARIQLIKPASTKISTKRILVVDDETINQQVIVNYLADEDIEIVLVSSGADAIEVLDKQVFDMVLLDVMMPKMSGYEVCKYIRKTYLQSDLPVIMITAKNQVNDLVDSLSYGANDYLAKPFSKSEFLARLKTHLNLHSINQAYVKFVPKEFLNALGKKNIVEVKLGDQHHEQMSILFSDIRSYTTLSESMTPEDNFNFLNAYLSRVGPSVKQHNGFVNNYYGDGIMALFSGSPQNSLNAAINMQNRVTLYNKGRAKKNRQLINIGVGIHSGELMIGILGDEFRLNAGVVSDAVNASSRLEGLTKIFGVKIIMSQPIYQSLKDPNLYCIRYLGMVTVVGKANVMRIYECFDTEDKYQKKFKQETKHLFESGLSAYTMSNFSAAKASFTAILAVNPADKAAQLYFDRSNELLKSPDENFTGALDISRK